MKRFLKFEALLVGFTLIISLSGCGGGGGPKPPSYRALGVGVIMQSRSELDASMAGKNSYSNTPATQSAWKRMDISLNGVIGVRKESEPEFRAAALPVSDQFLEDYVSFIYLKWDRVNGASHYKVLYNNQEVWDSVDVPTSGKYPDPAFEENNPQAYLDLDDELDGVISSAGPDYRFIIVALNGNSEIRRFPEVSVSLGMHLDRLPETIAYGSPNLTWIWNGTEIVDEYKVTFKRGTDIIDSVITVTNSYNINANSLLTSGHFEVWVDARHMSDNGVPIEVTRGIGGVDVIK